MVKQDNSEDEEEEEGELGGSSIITVCSNPADPKLVFLSAIPQHTRTANNHFPGHRSRDEADNHQHHQTPSSMLQIDNDDNDEVVAKGTFVLNHPKHNTNTSYSSTCSTKTSEDDLTTSTTTTTTTTTTLLQTIVEVVNPVIAGHGFANTISIGRSADGTYPSLDEYANDDENDDDQLEFETHEAAAAAAASDEEYNYSDQHELSLNDKMKNVLQELLKNERVQLNWSRSQEETEPKTNTDDDDGEEDYDHPHSNGNCSTVRSLHLEKNDSFDTNRNFDCQVYSNPGADVTFQTPTDVITSSEQLSASDEELKNRLLSELQVIDAEPLASPTTETSSKAIGDISGTRSTNGNKKKNKKNKNKNKKK